MADAKQIYRRLLKLYPARFREEYEAPLERQFSDEYREAGTPAGRARFWLRAICDLAVSIPGEFLRELRQDLAYAGRVYRRRSLVTGLALAALALAIGATTGVFSVVNALLIRSLPFHEPARLMEAGGYPQLMIQGRAAFYDWRARSLYWEDAATYRTSYMNLTRTGGAARAAVTETSANFFAMLGSEPGFGRSFRANQDIPGGSGVAVIGYGLWQQMFGGDPRALGAIIHVNGVPLEVVGVAAPGFDYPAKTALWTSTVFDLQRLPDAGAIFAHTIGRLKPGMTIAQANQIMTTELRGMKFPMAQNPDDRPRLISLQDQLAGRVRQASWVLLAVVAFVLLIACANVAHLLLSRMTERRPEMAVRAALGASRARLVQQLITESMVLTLTAAAAGLVVARWAARLASSVQPAQLTTQSYSILDWRVLGFAIAVALTTGVIFGVLPAWLIGRAQPAVDAVRAQGGAGGSAVSRTRTALIALQAALTVMLLAGSVTMGRSFLKLLGTDLGFRTENVATFSVSLLGTHNEPDPSARQYFTAALRRLESVPGVEATGAVEYLPLSSRALYFLGVKMDSGVSVGAMPVMATPHYFAAIGAQIIAGRDFTNDDQDGAEPVAIVNQEFARKAGGGPLIGRKLTPPFRGSKPATIVGVVGNTRFDPAAPALAQVYLAVDQRPPAFATFVTRVHGDPARYLAVGRDAIQQVDPQVPVFDVMTLPQRLNAALAKPRFYTIAILFFAGFAWLLALIGIYGVASYTISQRTHEIGIRIAVGAPSGRLRRSLLGESMLPMAAGMLVGIAGALELGQFLQRLMFGVDGLDARTSAAAALWLALAAALAVWRATARVLRVDPMKALRAE